MSKAILVMDMPDSCAKCPFVEHEDEGWLYCSRHNSDAAFAFKRADYCPIKPMPEKDTESYFPDEYADGYKDGYNACINKILKD